MSTEPSFDTYASRLLLQIWRFQYPIPLFLVIFLSLKGPLKIPNRMRTMELNIVSLCLPYFINPLMHSGLKVELPLLGKTILIPQFAPSTCAAATAETWTPSSPAWPCQRDDMGEWIASALREENVYLEGGCLLVALWSFTLMTHIAGLVWASNVFPNAGWRKWRWVPSVKDVAERGVKDELEPCSSEAGLKSRC